MSTITLSANRINRMPSLLTNTGNAVKGYKEGLEALRSKLLVIDNSVCNLEDVISSVKASTQVQEEKKESLNRLNQDVNDFITDVVRIDGDAADAINQSRDDFYNEYNYLKPCEKSGWEKFKDGCKKAGEWCKKQWSNFVNGFKKKFNELAAGFIDWVGRCINSQIVSILVEKIVYAALPNINIGKFWTKYDLPGAELFLKLTLGAVKDTTYDGVYHLRQDWWQSWGPIGYNDGYDNVFYYGVGATGNTIDIKKSVTFDVDIDGDGEADKTYMFWSWKGDYMNLGAGAETGIYEYYSDTHWLTATDRATDMELALYHKGELLYEYSPYGDTELWNSGAQWWVTGFDSQVMNVKAEDLQAVTTIDFTQMEDGEKMYEAFKNATLSSDDIEKISGWTFYDDTQTAILNWEADNWKEE